MVQKESIIYGVDRSIQLCLLGALFFIAIAQVSYIPYSLSALFFSILTFFVVQYYRQKFTYYQYVQIGVFALGIGLILFQFKTIVGVEAGVSFLTLCLFAKSFELKQKRDLLIVLNFALFVSATLFLHSQSFLMALCVIASLISCFMGLYRLQSYEFLKQYNKKPAIKQDIWQIGKFISLAIPFFVILFVFFPRFPPFWAIPIPENKAKTGMSDKMSPGDIAELSQSSELAFRIIGDIKQLPAQSKLYWRAMVLDHYDGKTWTRSSIHQEVDVRKFTNRNVVFYQYLSADPNQQWLMSLERSIPTSYRYGVFSDGSIIPKRATQQNLPIDFAWLKSEQANDFNDQPKGKINQSFVAHLDPKSQQLAQQLWQQSGQVPEQYVKNVLDWYRKENFAYTLKPATLGENRVDDFLFGSRQGFCEHYASSFSLLMRYAGVPARVVVGYQGGQAAPDNQSWEVRQLDAHAWTEVWLNQQWVRIDPTAIVAPNRIDEGMQNFLDESPSTLSDSNFAYQQFNLMRKLQIWSDYASYQWQSKVVGYDVDSQKSFLGKFGLTSSRQFIWVLMITLVLVIGLYYLWSLWRQKRLYTPYQLQIMRLNRQLPTALQQQMGESFSAWLKRIQVKSNPCFEQAIEIYQRVHYAEQKQATDVQQFEKAMKECAVLLKSRKNT